MSNSPFRDDALSDQSILVTGGGSGLGKEISKALAAKGATVHICGRRQNILEEAAVDIGGDVHWHVCDIRDPESIATMVDGIWDIGPLSGLVNNAAANFIAPTKSLSPGGFKAVTSTVMDGSFFITLDIGKRWIEQGIKGSVVSNLVTWVWSGSAYVVPSAMSKTALHAMTMSLAVEWGKYGIRLNATAPGPFPTEEAWEKLNPIPEAKSSATGNETIPMGRYGEMHELQNLIIFLFSGGCEFLTGQTIAIDGAQHLAQPGTFADLNRMSDEQWEAARKAIKASTERHKSNRAEG